MALILLHLARESAVATWQLESTQQPTFQHLYSSKRMPVLIAQAGQMVVYCPEPLPPAAPRRAHGGTVARPDPVRLVADIEGLKEVPAQAMLHDPIRCGSSPTAPCSCSPPSHR
jgi:hypothetical protein